MGSGEKVPGKSAFLRPGSGRYILLALFFLLWGGIFLRGYSRLPSSPLEVSVIGPEVLDQDLVAGWFAGVRYRTIPALDRDSLDRLRKAHPWIESVSEKQVPGTGRVVRVKVWTPVALLRPAYGLMAFQGQPSTAVPTRVSYLNDRGLSLLGRSYSGTGALPQVIVRSPLTRAAGLRLVRTIRIVRTCHSEGAPSGQWFSLNGPHEIRFYPSHNFPVLLLGTDLGCSPFRLFRSYMKNSGRLSPGKLPEGIDLRFSGMLILRPSLENIPFSPDHVRKIEARS